MQIQWISICWHTSAKNRGLAVFPLTSPEREQSRSLAPDHHPGPDESIVQRGIKEIGFITSGCLQEDAVQHACQVEPNFDSTRKPKSRASLAQKFAKLRALVAIAMPVHYPAG